MNPSPSTPADSVAQDLSGQAAVLPAASAGVTLPAKVPPHRRLQLLFPTRRACAKFCYGYGDRVRRDPGAAEITGGHATDDPRAFQDDDAVLAFTATGRRASFEDMARMPCSRKRATALLASGLTKTCACVEALTASASPGDDQVAALAHQTLVAVPYSALHPQKLVMPASLVAALNRDTAGRVKRTIHISSTPMDFVHDDVVEEGDHAVAT